MTLIEMLLVGAIVDFQERVMEKNPPSDAPDLELVDLGDEVLCELGLGPEDWGPWCIVERNGVKWTVSSVH